MCVCVFACVRIVVCACASTLCMCVCPCACMHLRARVYCVYTVHGVCMGVYICVCGLTYVLLTYASSMCVVVVSVRVFTGNCRALKGSSVA